MKKIDFVKRVVGSKYEVVEVGSDYIKFMVEGDKIIIRGLDNLFYGRLSYSTLFDGEIVVEISGEVLYYVEEILNEADENKIDFERDVKMLDGLVDEIGLDKLNLEILDIDYRMLKKGNEVSENYFKHNIFNYYGDEPSSINDIVKWLITNLDFIKYGLAEDESTSSVGS